MDILPVATNDDMSGYGMASQRYAVDAIIEEDPSEV